MEGLIWPACNLAGQIFVCQGLGCVTDIHENLEALLSQADRVAEPQRGDLLRGIVISTDEKGLIIDLGLKRDGVIPAEDLGTLPLEESNIKVGDEIAVMVVDPVDRDGNLAVSIAQARESEDWLEAHRLMAKDEIFEAVPSGYNRGGLIVPFGRLRGFVPASHLSELPRGLDEDGRSNYLHKMVGEQLPFKVIEVDPRRRRLVFSERKAIRQWRQERKSQMIQQLSEGEIRKGVVTSLREFGAFVDIGGADGLIHISELSWKRVEDPAEVLSIGQEVDAQVILLDFQANRIGLSLKRLQPNPWDMATDRLEIGQVVEGSVSRLAAAGIYVQLVDGPEGLLRPPDGPGSLEPGMKIKIRVTAFEPARERLDLELIEINQGTSQSELEASMDKGGENQ
jgi:small subunit ribosomal protein S1